MKNKVGGDEFEKLPVVAVLGDISEEHNNGEQPICWLRSMTLVMTQ